jgi:peptide/nickel transport system substrate-binding protein
VTLPYNREEVIVLDQTPYNIFDTFNVYIPNGNEFAAGYYQVSLEYLWYANYVTGEITPWLAQGFSYNKDFTELTIKLNPDATWNDGKPFTGDDVAFTMNMVKKDPSLGYEGDSKFWKEITAPDPQTVLIKLTEPRPRSHQIFYCKICTGFEVQPKHIWETQDPKTFKNNPPVTTGPWMFEKDYPEQKIYVWKRNDNYWKKDSMPAAKYVVYRTGPTADQSLPEVKAHASDGTGSPGFDLYTQNAAQLGFLNQVAYLDPCPRGVHFNCAQAPFDTAEFRRGFSMLINRPKIAQNIWAPPSTPAEGPWAAYKNLDPFINKDANEKWGTLKFDPDAALKLMTSVGYKQDGGKLMGPDGKQVAFEIVTPNAAPEKEYLIAQDLAEEANKLGMQVSVKPLQGNVFGNTIDEGQWACGSWWLCGSTVDPLELFDNYTSDLAVPIGTRAASGNEMRLKDDAYDKAINALKPVAPEDPAAAPLYKQAYDEFMRAAPSVPVIQTIYTAYWDTTFWSGGLDQKSLYTVPFNWWGQYLLVTIKAQPTGQKA